MCVACAERARVRVTPLNTDAASRFVRTAPARHAPLATARYIVSAQRDGSRYPWGLTDRVSRPATTSLLAPGCVQTGTYILNSRATPRGVITTLQCGITSRRTPIGRWNSADTISQHRRTIWLRPHLGAPIAIWLRPRKEMLRV